MNTSNSFWLSSFRASGSGSLLGQDDYSSWTFSWPLRSIAQHTKYLSFFYVTLSLPLPSDYMSDGLRFVSKVLGYICQSSLLTNLKKGFAFALVFYSQTSTVCRTCLLWFCPCWWGHCIYLQETGAEMEREVDLELIVPTPSDVRAEVYSFNGSFAWPTFL